MRISSSEHKEIVGSVPDNNTPFKVSFDETGHAEVDDEAVGNYLLQLGAATLAQPILDPNGGGNPDEVKSPEEMNVPQLKKFAKDNGIDLGQASKKDEILPVINSFLEQKSKEEEEAAKAAAQGQGGGAGDQ